MKSTYCRRQGAQRGAATLLVVVVLFFILALVTAYTSRNLIFEQRTSANGLRSTQAFEAAEAGVEFAVALLSAGRVNELCLPTADTGQSTFRQRHLTQDSSGAFLSVVPQSNLRPTCLLRSTGAECGCPSTGLPDFPDPVSPTPTYQVRFETTGLTQPGIVRVRSKGCSSLGSQCFLGVSTAADAEAEISVLLGLNSALATPPSAALTVRGTLDLGGGTIGISNADVPSGGITIDSGGTVINASNARLSSVPGSPGAASVQASDPSLTELNSNRLFVSVFGMDRATYRSQPAVVRVTCNGDCALPIASAVAANPGRIVWVEGNATIDSNQILGSPASPVMLVVQGNLTASANLELHGVLYLHGGGGTNTWTTSAGTTLINGAVIAEDNLTVAGGPTIAFSPGVLRTINLTQGSMVRVPGSWRDFAAGS